MMTTLVFVFVLGTDTRGRFCPQVAVQCKGLLCCCRHDDEAHKGHSPRLCTCMCVHNEHVHVHCICAYDNTKKWTMFIE